MLVQLREVYGPGITILYVPQFDYFGDTTAQTDTERLVQRTASRLGVGFVDVRYALSRRYDQTRQPLNGFANTVPGTGHWNAAGHKVIAAELVRFLTSVRAGINGESQGDD